VGNGISRPTAILRLIDVPRLLPVIEAARKGRPDDPGLPVTGCAYLRLTDGVAPVFEQAYFSSFALAGEAVLLRITETSLRRPPIFE
jgi:hypothetical protein